MHRATGASRSTIRCGIKDIAEDSTERSGRRVRAPGGGRKKAEVADPELLEVLDSLIEPGTRGDPESPLRWTTKSTREIAGELTKMGHPISHTAVAGLLHSQQYSLPGTRKTLEGRQHPDRDDQFRYLNALATELLTSGDPVISVEPRRRTSSDGMGRAAKNGTRKANQSRCPLTTSPVKPTAKPFPTESMT